MQLIDVQWGRLRPGVTILRGDGHQAKDLDPR